ncbi:MAG: DNA-directed RNA polymerase subunit alpha [Candidatus Pacebacteria bacterium]|nr:DNA-directed RNA polymerase subunit alpha [Candidatus Paceibacterota bacterium]
MITLPTIPKIIEKKDNKAIFEIAGLYPGYGVTIGNTLRRVLFSSLSGVAVTQVKIKGVAHEFSTIPGIYEDVITIILNLKQLRFKYYTEESQKVELKVKGVKEIKASDLKTPTQVEIVNKDLYIASLTDPKATLEIEITVEKGLGYSPAEERKKEKIGVGVIAVDAFFTPIKVVNYKVENMRVGERTDFDRLRIDIETDGTITPEEAFTQATGILFEHFSLLFNAMGEEKTKSTKRVKLKKVISKKKKPVKKIVKKSKKKS